MKTQPSLAGRDEIVPTPSSSEQIALPDIKETLQKKEDEERARVEEEKLKDKRKIKRSDKEAFARVSPKVCSIICSIIVSCNFCF